MDKIAIVFYCNFETPRCPRDNATRWKSRSERKIMLSFFFQLATPREMCSGTHVKSNNFFFRTHFPHWWVWRRDGLLFNRRCSARFSHVCRYAANEQWYEDIASWILRSVWLSSGDFSVESIVYDLTFPLRVIWRLNGVKKHIAFKVSQFRFSK